MFEKFWKQFPFCTPPTPSCIENLRDIFTTVLLLCSSHSLSATAVQDCFIPDLDIVNWRSVYITTVIDQMAP